MTLDTTGLTMQLAGRATDFAPEGLFYERRFVVATKDAEGVFHPLDLSAYPELVVKVQGGKGTPAPVGSGSAEYDETNGGAEEGAVIVRIAAEALLTDRDGENDVVQWTCWARAGRSEQLCANVGVTVYETAA